MDYVSGPYTMEFPAGEINASLSISINNDNVVEDDEKFGLTINKSLLSTNVFVGNNSEFIVTILDDDSE